jgi:hypothetical protein
MRDNCGIPYTFIVFAIATSLLCEPVGKPNPQPGQALPQGSHMIRNQKFQLMLRPRDASRSDGTPIVLYPYQPWKCMAWRFEPDAGGSRLVNYYTGKSFEGGGATGGTVPLIQMPATPERAAQQAWKFVTLGGGFYRIEAPSGGLVLTATEPDGDGDHRVVLSPWKDSGAQKWQLLDLPERFTA